MAVNQKLLRRARQAPQDLSIAEAKAPAKQCGFVEDRQKGGHVVYHHPDAALIRNRYPRPLNLQEGLKGKAKAYQVRQLLAIAEALGVI
jgi:hypothetical protein